MCMIVTFVATPKNQALMSPFVCSYKHREIMSRDKKIPNPIHLITNLAYRLKLHHNRNMYLHARLDTCADIKYHANQCVLLSIQRSPDE